MRCRLCVAGVKHPREVHLAVFERARLLESVRIYRMIGEDAERHGWVKVASAAARIARNREMRLAAVDALLTPYRSALNSN